MSFWQTPPLDADEVRAVLAAARARDATFASGRILGSMCTDPHPLGAQAFLQYIDTNLGDPLPFAGARDLEAGALALMADMMHAPPGGAWGGRFVSGGSEGNFTALRIALKRTGRREVILPQSAHFSFDKSVEYLGLVPVRARLTPEYRVDVEHVRALMNDRTAAVVAIAGTTEHGVVDPIPGLAQLCSEARVHLHVDAAFGGFLLPFLDAAQPPLPGFDFRLPGVETISLDPHKNGCAPIPSGVVLARDAEDFERISTPSPYVSVRHQATLAGTRPGAAAAATFAVMRHLGPDGYRRNALRGMDNARWLARRLRELGCELAREPETTIVVARVKDPSLVRRLLSEEGWFVSLAPLSGGIKIVCMPHVTRESITAFLPVFESVLRKTGDL